MAEPTDPLGVWEAATDRALTEWEGEVDRSLAAWEASTAGADWTAALPSPEALAAALQSGAPELSAAAAALDRWLR
jgi:hypothetical protein